MKLSKTLNYNEIAEANRLAWNEVTPIHQKARELDLKDAFSKSGYSCLDEVITKLLLSMPLAGKNIAQLNCNNGRELLSIINLGASSGVGFDISDEAIKEANELREIADLNAKFVRTIVYDITEKYFGRFDCVFISIGSLYWMPDLDACFKVITNILKPNGKLLIYESHPITDIYAN